MKISVMDVKIQLEQIQGDTFPSGWQRLIYKGNVLKDDTTMDDNGVTENSHLHVILDKAVESENTITACHFNSTMLSRAIMEDCSRISELRAIRGSSAFLRITDVFLVDEAAIDRLDLLSTYSQKQALHKNVALEEDAEKNISKVDHFHEEHTDLLGDMNLINEMVALGLPSSFCTTSKERHTSIKRKNRKPVKKREGKLAQVTEERDLPVVQAEVSNGEVNNETAVHLNSHFDSVELYEKDAISNQIVVNGMNGTCSPSENGSTFFNGSIISNNNAMTSMETDNLYDCKDASLVDRKTEIYISVDMMCEDEIGVRKSQNCNGGLDDHSELHLACFVQERTSLYNVDPKSDIEFDISRVSCPPHVLEVSQLEKDCLQNNVPTEGVHHCVKSNWEAVWDSYYQRYYYYNYETLETSWDLPGLEHSTQVPSVSYRTDNCVTGSQAICEASSGSNDECSQAELKDNEENIESMLGCQTYSQVYHKLADDTLNKVKVEEGTVHHVKDNIMYACLIENNNFNTEKIPTHNLSDSRQDDNIVHEETDISLTTSSPGKDMKIISTKASVKCLEQSSDCCLSRGSGFSNHLLSSLNTIESLHPLPEACGTHIWFDDEGNIEKKCSLQHEASHIHAHAHAHETYNNAIEEAISEDTSIPETFNLGNDHLTKEQKKKKSSRLKRLSSINKDGESSKKLLLPGTVEEMSTSITKYWCQRYQLFSKFDEGVQLDEEGWFSVTPEIIAKHHAARCGTDTIIDCFTGVGGNAIQFAQKSHHVVAIDIDPKKIDYARHNARLYGVADYIDFIVGDFFQLAPFLKANVVFLSPPWGGPDYLNVESYDIQDMLRPKDGYSLFKAAQMIAKNIVMFLPRNVDLNQLAELSLHSSPPLPLQIEKNYVNGRIKAITAYFGRSSLKLPSGSFRSVLLFWPC